MVHPVCVTWINNGFTLIVIMAYILVCYCLLCLYYHACYEHWF